MAYVGLDTGTAANAGDGSTLRAGGILLMPILKKFILILVMEQI